MLVALTVDLSNTTKRSRDATDMSGQKQVVQYGTSIRLQVLRSESTNDFVALNFLHFHESVLIVNLFAICGEGIFNTNKMSVDNIDFILGRSYGV